MHNWALESVKSVIQTDSFVILLFICVAYFIWRTTYVDMPIPIRIPAANTEQANSETTNIPVSNDAVPVSGSSSESSSMDEYTPDGSDISEDEQTLQSPEVNVSSPTAEGVLIKMQIRFVDDTILHIEARSSDTIANFKREHLSSYTEGNKEAKLIFQGKVLSDNLTLQQCGLQEGCVLHCLITNKRQAEQRPLQDTNPQRDLDLSPYLSVVLTSFLVGICYFFYRFPEVFDHRSRVLLSIICIMLSLIIREISSPVAGFHQAVFVLRWHLGLLPANQERRGTETS